MTFWKVTMNNYLDQNYKHNTSYIVKITWDKDIDSDICDDSVSTLA